MPSNNSWRGCSESGAVSTHLVCFHAHLCRSCLRTPSPGSLRSPPSPPRGRGDPHNEFTPSPPRGRGEPTQRVYALSPLGERVASVANRVRGFFLRQLLRNRAGPGDRGRKFPRAERAVEIPGADSVMAGGARGVQVVFALRAEIEGRVRHGPAIGACDPQWLPHEEVDDETNGVGDKDYNQCPQDHAHSPSLRVAVHIADQQHEESDYYAPQTIPMKIRQANGGE